MKIYALPLVAKITRRLEELQEQKPELIPDVSMA